MRGTGGPVALLAQFLPLFKVPEHIVVPSLSCSAQVWRCVMAEAPEAVMSVAIGDGQLLEDNYREPRTANTDETSPAQQKRNNMWQDSSKV
jgi:hypothetical protein